MWPTRKNRQLSVSTFKNLHMFTNIGVKMAAYSKTLQHLGTCWGVKSVYVWKITTWHWALTVEGGTCPILPPSVPPLHMEGSSTRSHYVPHLSPAWISFPSRVTAHTRSHDGEIIFEACHPDFPLQPALYRSLTHAVFLLSSQAKFLTQDQINGKISIHYTLLLGINTSS